MPEQAAGRTGALPLSKALKISLASLRTRVVRSSMNTGVVALSTAFFTYVLASHAAVGAQAAAAQQRTLLWSALLSLMVAGVGITNSFLITVSERFREIGTLKCLGARNQFVLLIVMLEAMIIGISGAVIGSVGGSVGGIAKPMAAQATDYVADWNGIFMPACWGILLGSMLALVGAILPALRASKMAPAEAMRVEV